MKSENIILLIAAVTAIVAVISAGFTYYSVSTFKEVWITGFASNSNGSINITINSNVALNFTNYTINWGSGNVNAGTTHANLTTSSAGYSDTGGTWTIAGSNNGSTGFVLQNIGTVNLTVSLHTGKTASQFIGGTNPLYQYNVTDVDTGACLNITGGTGAVPGGYNLSNFFDVNTTHPGTQICGRMPVVNGANRIRIDMRLSVPYDSSTGTLNDTVSAAFSQAP